MNTAQAVRDLLWVVNSPSLIHGAQVADAIVLDAAAIDPAELGVFISEAKPSHRVGRYFERLVLFWLERIRKVRIVASGQQIREGNRTLGEVDFIFEDEGGRVTHWETAVKFFLHFPNDDGSHFPGPNASDNFERKMTKLFEKQLRFSEQHFPNVQVREAFVKGMTFYRPEVSLPTFPTRLCAEHCRGVWVRESELDWFERFPGWSGKVMSKPHWLAAPIVRESVPPDLLREEIAKHFSKFEAPLMVSLLRTDSEERRLFVVPDAWPAR